MRCRLVMIVVITACWVGLWVGFDAVVFGVNNNTPPWWFLTAAIVTSLAFGWFVVGKEVRYWLERG